MAWWCGDDCCKFAASSAAPVFDFLEELVTYRGGAEVAQYVPCFSGSDIVRLLYVKAPGEQFGGGYAIKAGLFEAVAS